MAPKSHRLKPKKAEVLNSSAFFGMCISLLHFSSTLSGYVVDDGGDIEINALHFKTVFS